MLRRSTAVARRANSLRKKFAALRATQRWKRRRWASPGSPSPSSLPRCSSRRGAAAALDVPSEAAGHVLDGPLTCRCLRPWACSHRSPPHAGARTDTLPRARRAPWPRRRTLAVRRQPSLFIFDRYEWIFGAGSLICNDLEGGPRAFLRHGAWGAAPSKIPS